uniref:FAD-dependent monooxygenase n=1 Tax=Suttonella ornithocola TaxID=279832 RepID=UPI0009339B40
QHDSKRRPIDTLGYLVSNHLIRKAAYDAAQTQNNIRWLLGHKVVSATSNHQKASVTLDNGETLTASLLVAADSRLSFVRRQMGIVCEMHDFGRTVLVFRLEHEISNDHTAFECFFYGSTLALLPLTDYMTNCVITIDTRKLHTLTKLSPEGLAEYVEKQVNHRFGKMTLVSEVCDYPLMGTHARQFYANRCALIGDAACGMHPVTAHGFNLGLKSQDILARLIMRQAGQGKDIGASSLLVEYSRKHRKNTLPLYLGTNIIVGLFTRESAPAKFLRDSVLRISNRLPPLKTLITRQLTG